MTMSESLKFWHTNKGGLLLDRKVNEYFQAKGAKKGVG